MAPGPVERPLKAERAQTPTADMAARTPKDLTRTEFKKRVAEQAAALRARLEADAAGLADDPAAIAARRAAALAPDGLEVFCRTYFPHYIASPNSRLHNHLYTRLPALLADPASQCDAIAAPRGEAKSTLCAALFPLWCLVRGAKRFLLLIADATHQSSLTLEAIKTELEANPRLKLDFPEQCGAGKVWQEGEVITTSGVKLLALGSGRRLRGLRHGPHRPDLIVLDDIENDENVRSGEQRDKLDAWVDQAVLNVGGAGVKCDVLLIGTILHYDSVLARKLRNPLWQGVRFQALLRWPDRMDLWQRWEEILRNAGVAAADRFHAENAAAMDQGAEVSWPAARPLPALMKLRVRIGAAAFDAELQNEPVRQDAAAFGTLPFWVEAPTTAAGPDGPILLGACDPSLGHHNRNRDPSALLVGALDRASGRLDVIEAQISRRLPDRLIEDILTLQARHGCLRWAIESVQFQAFFASELVKRGAARGIPIPVVPVVPHTDKALRIESLQPHVANGLIRLHASQTVLIDQLRHWPAADHDDGPDALEMLWSLARSVQSDFAYRSAARRPALAGGPDTDARGAIAASSGFARLKGAW